MVLLVVGLAVNYSSHTRALIDTMAGTDRKANEVATLELVRGERFMNSITREQLEILLKSVKRVEIAV